MARNKAILGLALGAAVLWIGIAVGWALPDSDQVFRTSFLNTVIIHRSILTHAFYLPLLCFALALVSRLLFLRLLTIGGALALAVHFSFDLFPRAWTGYALIHVPFIGRLSPLLSVGWLVLCVMVCLYLAYFLIRTTLDVLIVAGTEAFLAVQHAAKEPQIALAALLALLVMTVIVVALPSDLNASLRGRLYRWLDRRID